MAKNYPIFLFYTTPVVREYVKFKVPIGGALSGGLVGACLGALLEAIGSSAWDAIGQCIGF